MSEITKITDSLEDLKRQFMNMQSPSAFGAIHSFDSIEFMNIPPEMARRDAAYTQLAQLFYDTPFNQSCQTRQKFYSLIIARLKMVIEKSEYIRLASEKEERDLDGNALLPLARLVMKYFVILDELADSQAPRDDIASPIHTLFAQMPTQTFSSLGDDFYHSEEQLYESIKAALHAVHPILFSMQEQRRKQFAKKDSERYEKAYSFYLEYYSKLENL